MSQHIPFPSCFRNVPQDPIRPVQGPIAFIPLEPLRDFDPDRRDDVHIGLVGFWRGIVSIPVIIYGKHDYIDVTIKGAIIEQPCTDWAVSTSQLGYPTGDCLRRLRRFGIAWATDPTTLNNMAMELIAAHRDELDRQLLKYAAEVINSDPEPF